MELRVDRVCTRRTGVKPAPDLDKATVVLVATQPARPMPRRERGRFVEEEQLCEAARLHQRRAMPPAELKPTGDPPLPAVAAADPPLPVVEASAIPINETAGRIGDQLAERRDPVLQRHSLH